MYAAAIFGIGLAGLIGLESATSTSLGRLHRLTIAEQIVMAHAERMRSLPTTSGVMRATVTTTYRDRLGRVATDPAFSGSAYTLTTTVTPGGASPVNWVDAVILCSWNDMMTIGNSQHATSVTTRIAQP